MPSRIVTLIELRPVGRERKTVLASLLVISGVGAIVVLVGATAYAAHRLTPAVEDAAEPQTLDELTAAMIERGGLALRICGRRRQVRQAIDLVIVNWPAGAEQMRVRDLRQTLLASVRQQAGVTLGPLAVTLILIVIQALINWWLENHPLRQQALMRFKAALIDGIKTLH